MRGKRVGEPARDSDGGVVERRRGSGRGQAGDGRHRELPHGAGGQGRQSGGEGRERRYGGRLGHRRPVRGERYDSFVLYLF